MQSKRPINNFEIQQPSSGQQIQFRTSRLSFFITFISFLFICASIGLFAYVNLTFLINIKAVSDKTIFINNTKTQENCDYYFCDQTAYHLINNYSFYNKCNQKNCQNVTCTTYLSNDTENQYILNYNRYYACEDDIENKDTPQFVLVIFSLAIAAAILLGIFVLLPLLYGILASICIGNLNCCERISLAFTCFWPSLKYYTFRQRTNWTDIHINFRAMLVLDYIGCLFHTIVLAIYIWFYIFKFWKSQIEILNFFFLIFSNIVLFSQVARNSKTFWNLNDLIKEHKQKILA